MRLHGEIDRVVYILVAGSGCDDDRSDMVVVQRLMVWLAVVVIGW